MIKALQTMCFILMFFFVGLASINVIGLIGQTFDWWNLPISFDNTLNSIERYLIYAGVLFCIYLLLKLDTYLEQLDRQNKRTKKEIENG